MTYHDHLESQGWYTIHKINMIYNVNIMEDKNHMIISINGEKAFAKIQYPFIRKIIDILGIERTYLNRVNAIYDKHITNIIIPNDEKLKTFLLRSGISQGWQLLPLLFNIVLEILHRAIRQERHIKKTSKPLRVNNALSI